MADGQGLKPIQTLQPLPDQGGQMPVNYSTPEQVQALRNYVKALEGHRFQQVASPWQGLSNMANALVGGVTNATANQRQIESERYRRSLDPYPPGTMGTPQQQPQAPQQAPQIEGNPVALGFSGAAPGDSSGGLPVRGSWFGNFQGQNRWVDKTDSGKQAGGQSVQDAPGIALPKAYTKAHNSLGQLFDVTTPDGRTVTMRQTDIGPAPWTGRGVDINSSAAEQMGYTPKNFPTDGRFTVRLHQGGGISALPFSGQTADQVYSGFQPAAAGQAPGQMAQAAPGQTPMSMALSGRTPAAPGGTMPPMAGAPAPGLIPMRPQVGRQQYINALPDWATPEQQQYLDEAYRMQHMPVGVPGMGGQWIINPDTGVAMWVAQPQTSDFGMGGGVTRPAPWHYGPGGEVVPAPVMGGPAPSAAPAPQGTATKPVTLGPQSDRPSPITPPTMTAPQFSEPPQAAAATAGTAGLPPEITKGFSEPKGEAPKDQSRVPQALTPAQQVEQRFGTMKEPSAPTPGTKAQTTPQSMLTTKPPEMLAYQPGQVPEVPAGGGAGFGTSPWNMTPEQQMGIGIQREISVKAGEAQATEDAKKYSDWMDSTQRAVDNSFELLNRMQLAKKYVQDGRLLQGPGADTIKMPWNKFLSFFGDKDATERVGISQAFDKLKSSNILSDLRQKLQGLGQIRLAEIALAAMSNIGRDNTPAANMAILGLGERLQWQIQKLGQIEQQYDQGYRWDANGNPLGKVGGQRSYADLHAAEMQFMKNNPIATDEDMNNLDHMFDMGTWDEKTGKYTKDATGTQKPATAQPDVEELRKQVKALRPK